MRLRPVERRDLARIKSLAKKEENSEYFRRFPAVFTWPEDTLAWWTGTYIIETLDEAPLGLLNLANVDTFHRQAEIGLLVDKELCGAIKRRDVVVSALHDALDYIFSYLGFERAYFRILSPRTPLAMALTEWGFTCEGTLRHNVFFNGQWHDETLFSALRSEWPNISARKLSAKAQ